MFWLAIHLISTAMMVTGALGVFGAGDAPAWMVTVDGVVAGVIGSAGIALGVAAVYGLRYTTGRPDADSGLARG